MRGARQSIRYALAGGCTAGLTLVLCACSGSGNDKPPERATDKAPAPQDSSVIVVPIAADSRSLTALVEQAVPQQLWSINQHSNRCVAPKKVKIFGKQLNVTPPISCTIVGQVTRGPIRLHGSGKEIIADIPIHAAISARDVGGVLKGETATGAAMAHAHITLDIRPDWSPVGTVRLSYDWTTQPGIDFLGQRITFTQQADQKLASIKSDLEKSLPRELAKLNLRAQAEQVWKKSFTTLLLNEENPPVWMRISPKEVIYDGYGIANGKMHLNLAIKATTETFVGQMRPKTPTPLPLPNLVKADTGGQLRFTSPVIADYAQLEPVLLKALVKRAQQPFDVPGLGALTARFDKVTMYGAKDGRIAVGVKLAAKPVGSTSEETAGLVWLTARPVNTPGSPKIAFEDLQVTGKTNGVGGDLLIKLVSNPSVSSLLASSLTQNFSGDLDKLLVKIRAAIATKQEGDFVLHGNVAKYEIGQIHPYGNGLYLPVRMMGSVRIDYRPN